MVSCCWAPPQFKGCYSSTKNQLHFLHSPWGGLSFHILCKGVPKAFSSQLPPRLLWRPRKFFHLFLAVPVGGLGNFFTYSLQTPVGVKAWGCKPFLLKHILLPLLLCCSPQMLLHVRFIIFIIFNKKHAPQICVSLHSTEM